MFKSKSYKKSNCCGGAECNFISFSTEETSYWDIFMKELYPDDISEFVPVEYEKWEDFCKRPYPDYIPEPNV